MTRSDAKKFLEGMGIAEPTDEQISNFLNTIGAETKKEKDRADGYKTEAEKAAEYKKQLDEINAQNMSEIEKANKATEDANTKIADLEKQLADMQLSKSLAEIGIIGEDATAVMQSMTSGDYSAFTSKLGQIITARETQSANAKEQELLKNTPKPSGSNGESGSKLSTAERLVTAMNEGKKASAEQNSVLANYINQ